MKCFSRYIAVSGLTPVLMAEAEAFLAKARAKRKSTSELSEYSSYKEGWTNHEAFTEDYFCKQARKKELLRGRAAESKVLAAFKSQLVRAERTQAGNPCLKYVFL